MTTEIQKYKCKFDGVKAEAKTKRSPVRSVKEASGVIAIVIQDERGHGDYVIMVEPSTRTYGLGGMA